MHLLPHAYKIPENHPLRKLFRSLADRALAQSSLPDNDLLFYLTDLLINFMHVENVYRLKDERERRLEYLVDMLEIASMGPQSSGKHSTNR